VIKTKYLLAYGLLLFTGIFATFAPAAIAPRFVRLPADFSYFSLEGTLWNMTAKDAHWQSRSVGDVNFSVNPLSIFTGTVNGQFAVQKKSFSGFGDVTLSDTLLLDDFEFEAQLSTKLGAVPVAGAVTIAGEQLEWDNRGQCLEAKANLTTNIPAVLLADFRSNMPDTIANINCINGRLQVSFNQDFGVGSLSGTGAISGTGMLNLALVLRFSDQAAISGAPAEFIRQRGFSLKQDGWYSEVKLKL